LSRRGCGGFEAVRAVGAQNSPEKILRSRPASTALNHDPRNRWTSGRNTLSGPNTMSEPIWNRFLTERDQAVFAASGYGTRAGSAGGPLSVRADAHHAGAIVIDHAVGRTGPGRRPGPFQTLEPGTVRLQVGTRWRLRGGRIGIPIRRSYLFRNAAQLVFRNAMDDNPPDRLSNDPASPYYNAQMLERGVGIRFKGVEKKQRGGITASAKDGSGWRRDRQGPQRKSHDHQADRRGRALFSHRQIAPAASSATHRGARFPPGAGDAAERPRSIWTKLTESIGFATGSLARMAAEIDQGPQILDVLHALGANREPEAVRELDRGRADRLFAPSVEQPDT